VLIVTCPRCRQNPVTMATYFSEYLCEECLKTEPKSLRERRIEEYEAARRDREKLTPGPAKG